MKHFVWLPNKTSPNGTNLRFEIPTRSSSLPWMTLSMSPQRPCSLHSSLNSAIGLLSFWPSFQPVTVSCFLLSSDSVFKINKNTYFIDVMSNLDVKCLEKNIFASDEWKYMTKISQTVVSLSWEEIYRFSWQETIEIAIIVTLMSNKHIYFQKPWKEIFAQWDWG